jgi:arylsulfatase A-like enzyme
LRPIAIVLALVSLVAALSLRGMIARRDPRLNVLLITVDTLRADHVGSYGYAGAQTPAIDALAARGLRFTQATTVAPLTLPAHSSLMTGTFPAFHGVRDNGGFYLPDDVPTLATLMRARGYRTGGFVSAFVLDHRWGIARGFDRYYDDFDLARYRVDAGLDAVQRPGSEVVAHAIDWLDQDRSRPFLAWVHLYEPHAPYEAPEPIRARFPPTRIGAYDAEIAAADIQVGRVIDHLASAGRLDRTVVVIAGDHGESLGEHGVYFDHYGLHEPCVRVPLVVWAPGRVAPARHGELAGGIDVAPTILRLASLPVPPTMQGRDLFDDAHTSATAFAESDGLKQIMVVEGRWKLIRTLRAFHYVDAFARDEGALELYDLEADPGEQVDVARREPEVASRLAHTLDAWHEAAMRDAPPAAAPERIEGLRALGYVE